MGGLQKSLSEAKDNYMNLNDNNPDPKSSESIADELDKHIYNWNYRLFEGEDGLITIGEVFYDRAENPTAWTETPIAPCSESVEGLIMELKQMIKATQKPIFHPKRKNTDEHDATNS